MILKRSGRSRVELCAMLLILPILICGMLGAVIGYIFRYRVQLRRFVTVLAAVAVFIVLEITTGTLSSKYSLTENAVEQFALLSPFLFLYLLPAAFGSFFVARRFRRWAE